MISPKAKYADGVKTLVDELAGTMLDSLKAVVEGLVGESRAIGYPEVFVAWREVMKFSAWAGKSGE
jgi:hypothetical protein